jgi:hypothetical protein
MKLYFFLFLALPLFAIAQKDTAIDDLQEPDYARDSSAQVFYKGKAHATFDTIFGSVYDAYKIKEQDIPSKIKSYIKKDEYGFSTSNLFGWKAIDPSKRTYYIIIAYWQKWCCGSSYLCFDEHFKYIDKYSGTYWCDTCF